MDSNIIIVITGATGTGKTTVQKYLSENYGVHRVITHTTRAKRVGEVDGVDYYFETDATFGRNHYLENVIYSGHQYGSSYEGLDRAWAQGRMASIVVDTAGAITYARALGEQAAVLFLTIDDESNLKDRLLARGDTAAAVVARLASPEYERDLQLPAALEGVATVMANDNWLEAQASIKQFMNNLLS